MNKTETILSKGQALYEDDNYLMLWTKFLGLSWLALTSYYVYVKSKQRLIKLNGKEKTYLMGLSYYLTKEFGLSPGAVLNKTHMFRDFAKVVAERGSSAWQNFFAENSKEKAKFYAAQASRR